MKNFIQEFEQGQIDSISKGRTIAPFKVGDTVSVKYKISEGTNTRIQAFNGIVIAKTKHMNHFGATFTVRKMSSGVGVERKFTVYSPLLSSVEVLKQGVVRKAKLYYLRSLTGKASRIKEKLDFFVESDVSTSAEKNDKNS